MKTTKDSKKDSTVKIDVNRTYEDEYPYDDTSPKLDKVEEFKALCVWAKFQKIKSFTFEGNEVEFDPQAFQAKLDPKPKMAPEGLRLLEKQQREEEFEELIEWST